MTTIATPHTTALTTELRYLALGDSYTIGEAVDEAGRWPVQLARLLRMEGVLVGDPRIIATTGWTTDELDAASTPCTSPPTDAGHRPPPSQLRCPVHG